MNRTNTTTGEDVTQTAEIDFTNERYTAWIESLSTRYRENQIKAAVAVNTEMLKFYFSLGRDIVVMGKDQPWGSGFLKRVSVDLKMKMPDADCFSQTNLGYMRRFFELYARIIYPQLGGEIESRETSNLEKSIYPQVGDELDSPIFHVPWGHHKCLIDKFLHESDKAMFRERSAKYRRHRIRSSWREMNGNFSKVKRQDEELFIKNGH